MNMQKFNIEYILEAMVGDANIDIRDITSDHGRYMYESDGLIYTIEYYGTHNKTDIPEVGLGFSTSGGDYYADLNTHNAIPTLNVAISFAKVMYGVKPYSAVNIETDDPKRESVYTTLAKRLQREVDIPIYINDIEIK